MRKLGFIFLVTLTISPVHAEIYKWTDTNGVVHFTDKPHPNAERIELPDPQEYSSPVPTPETPSLPVPAVDAPQYNITITQPTEQETLRNNQGYIPVILQIEPDLKAGDKLQLIFDGAELGEPQTAPVFALRDVNRGSHTLAVQIVDENGTIVYTTPAVTFFMHRPTVNMAPKTRKLKPTP